MKNLNHLKGYASAVAVQRKKQYALAIQNYTEALKQLAEETTENSVERAHLHTQIAKCYAQLAITKIFEAPDKLLNLEELNQFHAHLNQAETATSSLSGPTKIRRDKVIKRGITAAKSFLLQKLTDTKNAVITASKDRILTPHESKDFKTLAQEELTFLKNFYQHYLQNLSTDNNFYLVTAMSIFAQLALEQGGKAIGEAAINLYRNAIVLLDQALPLTGEDALVKPAALYFDRWYAQEQIAILAKKNEEKIAIYKEILFQFNDIFALTEDWETDKYYYHRRATQYCYAAYYAHKAHTALAALADTAKEKDQHTQTAQALERQFASLASAILPTELPPRHATNMLFAVASLTQVASSRAHSKTKIKDGQSDDEDDEDSDYESKNAMQVQGKQESASTSLSISTKRTSHSQKRTFSMQKPANSESDSSSENANESESENETEESSGDELLTCALLKKPAALSTKPTPPANRLSILSSAAFSFTSLSTSARVNLQTKVGVATTTHFSATHTQTHSSSLFKPAQEDRRWYTDANMLSALDRRLRGEIDRREVMVFGSVELRDVVPQILARRAEQLSRQARGERVARKFSIAVNLGQSHWAALSVDFSNGFNMVPTVHYADPLSTTINANLRLQLWQSLNVIGIHKPNEVYQTDGHNCGPWVVVLLESLAKTGHFPARSSINIAQQRTVDTNYFQQQANRAASGSAPAKKQKMSPTS